jgi:hypothetical protein
MVTFTRDTLFKLSSISIHWRMVKVGVPSLEMVER